MSTSYAQERVCKTYCVVKDHVLFIDHLQQPTMGQFVSGKMLSDRHVGTSGGGQSTPRLPCSSILSLCVGLSVFINLIERTPRKPTTFISHVRGSTNSWESCHHRHFNAQGRLLLRERTSYFLSGFSLKNPGFEIINFKGQFSQSLKFPSINTCCAKLLQSYPTLATPWTGAHQPPLSMGFSRQEYWGGLPFPFTGALLEPKIEPETSESLSLAGRFFTTQQPGNP